ncbi:MAG: polysaccharide deacetylase family protein [Pirellulales bacterium]|nr:polysaccharide deacetylase family protein [Pirellulales bacterium]
MKTFSSRRTFLSTLAGASAGLAARGWLHAAPTTLPYEKAQIALTLDLEMARNFPNWDDTHWDYEKGNLNQAAKDYTVEACRRVKDQGGVIHTFVVGQVLEQENVDWLKEIAAQGHPIGNHTYDHVYLLAQTPGELQYRFQRSPWLVGNRSVAEVLRENIQLTNIALKERVGVVANGFRTPGGFGSGLAGREDLQQMLLDLGFDWISCKYPVHSGIEDLHGSGKKPSQEAFDSILAAQDESQPLLYPTGLIDIPMSPISDIGAFRNGRWQLDDFLKAVKLAVEWAIERRAVFDFLAHPSCLGVMDRDFKAIDLICELVKKSNGAAEIVPLDIIAKRARDRLTQTN